MSKICIETMPNKKVLAKARNTPSGGGLLNMQLIRDYALSHMSAGGHCIFLVETHQKIHSATEGAPEQCRLLKGRHPAVLPLMCCILNLTVSHNDIQITKRRKFCSMAPTDN